MKSKKKILKRVDEYKRMRTFCDEMVRDARDGQMASEYEMQASRYSQLIWELEWVIA